MIGFTAFLFGCWLALKLERRAIAMTWSRRQLDVEHDTFYVSSEAL